MKLKKQFAIPIIALAILLMGSFASANQLFRHWGWDFITTSYAAEEVTEVTTEQVTEVTEVTTEATTEQITGKCGDNLTYTISSDGTTLTISGTGDMYNYDESKNLPPWSKYRETISSVNMSDGITSIGNYAFYNPYSNVSYYFDGATLEIPNSVVTIGDSAFYGCNGIISAIGGKSLKTIGDSAFFNCSMSNLKILNSVETIDNYAFSGCPIVNLKIPNSVKRIGSGAFYNCTSLYNLSIGNSVETIGSSAFKNCSRLNTDNTLILPCTVRYIGGEAFNTNDLTILITSIDIKLGSYAFGSGKYNYGISQGHFVKEVQCYPGSNFENYEYVENLDMSCPIKRTVATTGECGVNMTFTISYDRESVILKGYGNMYDFPVGNAPWAGIRDKLRYVMFSPTAEVSVAKIGANAFYDCYELRGITYGAYGGGHDFLPSGYIIFGEGAFYNCSALSIDISSRELWSVGANAFYNCELIEGTNLDLRGSHIGDYAFYNCQSLTGDLILGACEIGNHAFDGCSSISSAKSLSNGSEKGNVKLGEDCFKGIQTLYCYKGSVADKGLNNLGCNEKKYITNNATLEVAVPIEKNDEWVHKVGVSVTNGDTTYDKELINYTESDTEYKFVADMYINDFVSAENSCPLNYEAYYIYNYSDGDYDKQIAEGTVKPESEDDKSDKETLFKKVISQGTVTFTLKEVK